MSARKDCDASLDYEISMMAAIDHLEHADPKTALRLLRNALKHRKEEAMFIGDKVDAHCEELREIAKWFRERNSHDGNADFLEEVADLHKELFDGYWEHAKNIPVDEGKKFMDDYDGKALASAFD